MLLLADVDEYSFANAAYVMILPIFPIVTNNSYNNYHYFNVESLVYDVMERCK